MFLVCLLHWHVRSLPIVPPGTCTPIYIHRAERGDGILSYRKKELLSFLTAWVDFKGTRLSEINQTKTNTLWSHLHVGSKNKQKPAVRTDWCLPETEGWGWAKWMKWFKAQSSSYKINESQGCNAQRDDDSSYMIPYCILESCYESSSKKFSSQETIIVIVCGDWWMVIRLTMVIIS